jgi:hypothetical protein
MEPPVLALARWDLGFSPPAGPAPAAGKRCRALAEDRALAGRCRSAREDGSGSAFSWHDYRRLTGAKVSGGREMLTIVVKTVARCSVDQG